MSIHKDVFGRNRAETQEIQASPEFKALWENWPEDKRKAVFLKFYDLHWTVKKTAKRCGISSSVHTRWLKKDVDYKAAFEELQDAVVAELEDAAFTRAVEGYEEDVYQRGIHAGTVRKYSDSLLTFLLKANSPDKYRERVDIKTEHIETKDPAQALNEVAEQLEQMVGLRIADATE